MFGRIAKRYDLSNHLLSWGIDFWWRRALVEKVKRTHPSIVVDLATGSGDVAFALERKLGVRTEVLGLDFCQPMLDEAERKRLNRTPVPAVHFGWADILDLPLACDSVDAVTVAFGIRNLENRSRGLGEILRILRPGGNLFILEFSQPYRWFCPFYHTYLKYVLPILAGWITGRPDAYNYLGGTIMKFPPREGLILEMREAGFHDVLALPMTLGIVSIHQGTKGIGRDGVMERGSEGVRE